MNILDFFICINLDPERFLWIFFPFLLQGQSPNELYCCGKENDPQSSPNEHMLYFIIHRRYSTLPIKTGVTLLQRHSREPGHECTPCVPWHFLSVLKLTVCGLCFPRATAAVPVHLTFHFYPNPPLECTKIFITSSASQGLYSNGTFSSFSCTWQLCHWMGMCLERVGTVQYISNGEK